MQSTNGIFKELCQGYGIYWQRNGYNVNGDGCYATIGDARQACEAAYVDARRRERANRWKRIEAGAVPYYRHDDNIVAFTSNGAQSFTVRQWRNGAVWDIEDQADAECVYSDDADAWHCAGSPVNVGPSPQHPDIPRTPHPVAAWLGAGPWEYGQPTAYGTDAREAVIALLGMMQPHAPAEQ